MDPVAAVLALLVVAIAAWERRQHHQALAAERAQWQEERRELISRIQRPDFIPLPKTRPRPEGEPAQERPADAAAYRQVGVVQAISAEK